MRFLLLRRQRVILRVASRLIGLPDVANFNVCARAKASCFLVRGIIGVFRPPTQSTLNDVMRLAKTGNSLRCQRIRGCLLSGAQRSMHELHLLEFGHVCFDE